MRDIDEDGDAAPTEEAPLNFVSDPRAVCCRYMQFWFFIDLVTSLPLGSAVEIAASVQSVRLSRLVYVTAALRILRLPRLARISRDSRFAVDMRRWRDKRRIHKYCVKIVHELCADEPHLKTSVLNVAKYAASPFGEDAWRSATQRLLASIIFITHICACAWGCTYRSSCRSCKAAAKSAAAPPTHSHAAPFPSSRLSFSFTSSPRPSSLPSNRSFHRLLRVPRSHELRTRRASCERLGRQQRHGWGVHHAGRLREQERLDLHALALLECYDADDGRVRRHQPAPRR